MADGIVFDNIPGAGLVAPGFFFEVTSGGQFESNARMLVIGHANSGASLAVNTPVPLNSQYEADSLAGAGSVLADAYRIARANAPAQEIWGMAVAATGTTAAWTVSIDSVPAAGGVGVIEIQGEIISVSIAAGDTATEVATALAAAVNGYYNALTGASLAVTAASTDEVVTLTARHAGLVMNSVDLHVPSGVTGNAFGGATTITQTTTATGSPDLTTALAALGDDPFDFISTPFADETNLGRYETLMSDVSGRWSYLRQIYGHIVTAVVDSTGDLTTLGLGLNDRHLTVIPVIEGGSNPSPVWAWAAGLLGRVVPWLCDGATGNAGRNQTGLVVEGVRAPRNRAYWPGYTQRNTFLKSGVSTWSVNASGDVAIDKLITTYRTNPLGQADTVFRDIQIMAQLIYMLKAYRAALSYEHGNKAIADSNPGGLGALVTIEDIRATMVHTADELERQGVQANAAEFARRLVLSRDNDNPNRVNMLAPIAAVGPLDIIAANARLFKQYRQAAT
ncbi:phage tail sheath subtilisin-like domain-containing protein [Afifella aestuarii]|uniref:phage tail sheath subtilisin-like domain-containing protein n=1 Tax=Afifella aestuarii TaxID=1909496 RepID=UPI000FE3EEFB|nr:phage tail sheath subtilisin-like domain-containing protein [Afifella aestuarii]